MSEYFAVLPLQVIIGLLLTTYGVLLALVAVVEAVRAMAKASGNEALKVQFVVSSEVARAIYRSFAWITLASLVGVFCALVSALCARDSNLRATDLSGWLKDISFWSLVIAWGFLVKPLLAISRVAFNFGKVADFEEVE